MMELQVENSNDLELILMGVFLRMYISQEEMLSQMDKYMVASVQKHVMVVLLHQRQKM